MDTDYARRYETLYGKHWWWRARERAILRVLHRRQPTHGWPRILDVGCGNGLFFDALSRFGEVEGVEPDATPIDVPSPHLGRIHRQPFDESFRPGHRYALIVMADVLEHLDHPAQALSLARDLLTPDGMLLATVPAFNTVWTNHDVVNHHRTRYTKRMLRDLAAAARFRISEMNYWFYWTFPVKLLERAGQRLFGWHSDPARIPPAWINRALLQLTEFELRAIAPLHPPFGTSVMAILHPLSAHR